MARPKARVSDFVTRAPAQRSTVIGGAQRVTSSTAPGVVVIGNAQRVTRNAKSGGSATSGKGSGGGGR